jgi:2-succinyl-6-hydroxy-2,4-cyclohexadiene-1-carboxylate synthase
MNKKVLFLHGFMGSCLEGQFLLKLMPNIDLHSLELPDGSEEALEKFYDEIDLIKPHVIYGYSLGGRIALDYLIRRSIKCDTLILESVSFGITNEKLRLQRLIQDKERAKKIDQNFENFLTNWYNLELWGQITEEQRNKLITKRLNNWKNKTLSLSNMIINYSPGAMKSIKREEIDGHLIFISGDQDIKYKMIAKELTDVTHIEVINSGHNVHEFYSDQIIEELQKYF